MALWHRLSTGWRALIGTWAVLVLALAGGAGGLAWLGPPPAAPPPAAPSSATEIAPGTPAPAATLPAAPSAAGGEAAPPARAAATAPPAGGPPSALPSAPEPPALAALGLAGDAAPQPVRPIPPPDPALLEPGPHGPLPRIGPQGRSAIRTYGRPFNRQDPRPRIGLVVGGLGLNAAVTEEAIRRLPPAVTLAFSPYAPHVELLLDQARARGMEVLLALPLEPQHYPLDSPGNRALLTSLTEVENQDRLDWAMSRFGGYVGAIGAHGPMRGERYAMLPDRLAALQQALTTRGLLYVDPRPGGPQPARAWGRAIDILVDEPATRGEITLKLEALERLARERGTALGYAGEASPVLVERIAAWGGQAEARGVVLAPVTALIRPPAEPEREAGGGGTAGAATAAPTPPLRRN